MLYELTQTNILISILVGFYLYAVVSQIRSWYVYIKEIEKNKQK
jgi:hypothetical protein